jgi:hypothetical protein
MFKRSRSDPMLDEPIAAPVQDDAPPQSTPTYKDKSGAFVRNLILGTIAIAVVGGFAYSQMAPQTSAPSDQVAALTQPIIPPAAAKPNMPVSAAIPPTPILEEKAPVSKPAPRKALSVKARAASSDAPVPAPLLPQATTPSSAPQPQSVDVNPQTPNVLTPVPEQVAPSP